MNEREDDKDRVEDQLSEKRRQIEKEQFMYEAEKRSESYAKYGYDIYSKGFKRDGKAQKVAEAVYSTSNNLIKLCKFIMFLLIIIIVWNLFMKVVFIISDRSINSLSKKYDIKMKVISKEIDQYENGIYRIRLKKNKDIEFTAIKSFDGIVDDYLSQSLKYYFENWNSEYKDYFIEIEEIDENGLLDYKLIFESSGDYTWEEFYDVKDEFREYCGKNYRSDWKKMSYKE